MSVFAVLLSIVLFFTFAASGIQKMVFNPVMSKSAEHLGFTKRGYQRIGVVELIGALGLILGVAAHPSSFLGIVNVLAAAGLALAMALAVRVHLRRGDSARRLSPALVLGVLALLELSSRLS